MVRLEVLSDAEWLTAARKRLRDDGDASSADDVRLLGVRPAAEKGEFGGFLGDSLPVRVRVRLGNGTEEELAFFMKTLPDDYEAHTQMAAEGFRKEIILYQEVFSLMRQLPKGSKASPWAPRDYFTRKDLLVMEDLIAQGFLERDRRRPFDFDHAAITLEALGRFHASAWLLELEREKATGRATPFSQLCPEVLYESLFLENPQHRMGHWFGSLVRGLKTVISLIPKYKSSTDLKKIIEKFSNVETRMIELMKTSTKHRNVLNHADLWSNNILFRYDRGEAAPPTDVRLVDFQLARYTPPAVDINSLIYLTTPREVRQQHGGEMLCRYHRALGDALTLGGARVDDFLSWEQLVDTCDEYRDVGLIISPSYFHFIMMSPHLLKDQLKEENYDKFFFDERDDLINQCFREDEYYRTKIGGDVIELVDSFVFGEDAHFWKRAVGKRI